MATSGLGLGPGTAANAREGFDFDFVGRSLWRGGRRTRVPEDALEWAFSRDGGALGNGPSGGLSPYAADVPRWDQGGLMLEGPGQNLLSRSTEFANGAWTPIAGGTGTAPVVLGAVPDPLGGASAARVSFSRGGGEGVGDLSLLLHAPFPTTVGETYAGSLWMRAEAPTTLLMRHVGSGTYDQIAVGPTWRRVHMSSVAASIMSDFQIGLRGGGFGGGASAIVDVWNAQCEPGHATSDVVTGEAPGSRAADQLDLVHASTSAGTLILEATSQVFDGDRVLFDADGSTGLRLREGVVTALLATGDVSVGPPFDEQDVVRAALAWEAGRLTVAAAGSVASIATTEILGAVTVGHGSGDPFFGRLRRWRRLDRALGDAALAAVTS